MQQVWLNKGVSWDSPLPINLQKQWDKIMSEMHLLREVQVPRYILGSNPETLDLVGFADASGAAYAAVVYLRVTSNQSVTTYLLRARTKVAPLKTQTINKLELSAALLLANLMNSLTFLHKTLKIDSTYLFSDSTVALAWLKTPTYQLKTFVANRVSQILEKTDPSQWRHVSSQDNSADLGSRGVLPSQLIDNNLWFHGPDFLSKNVDQWPCVLPPELDKIPELKSTPVSLVTQVDHHDSLQLCERFSSLFKMERIIALLLRFKFNAQHSERERRYGSVQLAELQAARLVCIKMYQKVYFADEIKHIKKNELCSHSLQSLSPRLTSDGILVVGGRLSNAPLPEAAKHPILLPTKCHLSRLLVEYYHLLSMHGGPRLVQSLIQRHYWIVGIRSLIRTVLFKCVPCFKSSPRFCQPYMADIPVSRFKQGRAFINVGVDFGGPFSLKTGPRRNSPISKAYIALFVCMSTKAIHVELVTDLTTAGFIAALDRFVGRRGLPSEIHSDNGTNFHGAANYLQKIGDCDYLKQRQIKWVFNVPLGPNFNGLFEAGIKSVKGHLKHILKDQPFTFEELYTYLIRSEAAVNSRPICPLPGSPNDGVDVLTPGHFLTGAPLLARPEETYDNDENVSPLRRWQRISAASQRFWRTWSKDYINTQIQRSKWTTPIANIRLNDLVMIHNDCLPPQQWPLGRVISLHPGGDGTVRVVNIKTMKGVFQRPVSKVAVLPIDQDSAVCLG
uniref:Integrase catalytic domain-containing protein n=2 Tax=Cacopsylla melanoneura TaxID=428564 RepID=A0A8D8XVX5_9HEMI